MTTTIEVEKLESLLLNMKIDETYQPINWENITKSQNETTKAFEALARQVFALKDNLSKSFVCSLKELKDYDLKDQIQKVTDKKINQQGLKNLSQYAIYEGEDLKINYPELNKVVNDKQNTLLDQNQKVQAKLFETAQWIEAFLRGFNVSKESNIQQQGQQEQKGDQQLQANFLMQSNKTFDFPQDKLNEVVSKIQVTYIPDTKKYISIQTYQQIVENSADIAEEEFTRLTFQNRTDRRNIMHQDKKKYMSLMQESMNDIENLLMKAQEDICIKLGISQDILEKSEMCLMERGLGQHIFMMQASVRQKIKEKLPKKKDVSADQTKEIIRFQIKMLNEKQDYFMPILKMMPKTMESSQLVPILLNMMINDLVFEQYSLEDEDYMQNLNDQNAFNDKEIMDLLTGIEKGIYNLLTTSEFIPKGYGQPNGQMMMPPPMGYY